MPFKQRHTPLIIILFLVLHCVLPTVIHSIPLSQDSVAATPPHLKASNPESIDQLITQGEEYIAVDQDIALLYIRKAYELSEDAGYTKGVATSLLDWGRILYYGDDYAQAIDKFLSALALYEELGLPFGISECYFSLSLTHHLAGNKEKALLYGQKSLGIKKEISDTRGISICLNHIGSVYMSEKNYPTALDYFTQALEIKEKLDDQPGISTVLMNIGTIYDHLGDTLKARDYLEKALDIRIALNDFRRIASSQQRMGAFYLKQGSVAIAEYLFRSALEIYEKLNERLGLAFLHLNLARLYQTTNELQQAMAELNKSIELAEQLDNKQILSDSYYLLGNIRSSQGRYKEAYEALQLYQSLHDSIFFADRGRILTEMELKYQTAEKDRTIDLLQSSNQIIRQRILILTVSAIAMALAILLLIILIRIKNRSIRQKNLLLEKEKKIKNQEMEIQEKEKQILANQLELKNKELTANALAILRTNETLAHLGENLQILNNQIDADNKPAIKQLRNIISEIELSTRDNTWREFDTAFRQVNNDFYEKLLATCPELTPSEIKLAALLKLNLSTKEIEAITFKSESGIKSTRFRLRKKLNLDSDDNLSSFLMKL